MEHKLSAIQHRSDYLQGLISQVTNTLLFRLVLAVIVADLYLYRDK